MQSTRRWYHYNSITQPLAIAPPANATDAGADFDDEDDRGSEDLSWSAWRPAADRNAATSHATGNAGGNGSTPKKSASSPAQNVRDVAVGVVATVIEVVLSVIAIQEGVLVVLCLAAMGAVCAILTLKVLASARRSA